MSTFERIKTISYLTFQKNKIDIWIEQSPNILRIRIAQDNRILSSMETTIHESEGFALMKELYLDNNHIEKKEP